MSTGEGWNPDEHKKRQRAVWNSYDLLATSAERVATVIGDLRDALEQHARHIEEASKALDAFAALLDLGDDSA